MSELTILFMPESAYGPTNNCIGIGDVLRQVRSEAAVLRDDAGARVFPGRLSAGDAQRCP